MCAATRKSKVNWRYNRSILETKRTLRALKLQTLVFVLEQPADLDYMISHGNGEWHTVAGGKTNWRHWGVQMHDEKVQGVFWCASCICSPKSVRSCLVYTVHFEEMLWYTQSFTKIYALLLHFDMSHTVLHLSESSHDIYWIRFTCGLLDSGILGRESAH